MSGRKNKYFILCILLLIPFLEIHSQFVDFGKNKVQYEDFEWYVLSTEHYKIYFYKEAKELAEQAAYIAEEAYKDLQQKFNYSLLDTVPLIVYASPSHFRQTNTTPGYIPEGVGGFFEFIKGRVVVPFDGSYGNFRHVVKHELVHVFTVSKANAVLKTHGIISERIPPLWFVEGLAEFWSNEWDNDAEMVIKDAILYNYLPGLSDWERVWGTFIMYKLGQMALRYISEQYGEHKILELIDNFWLDDNFSNVMKFTIGKDYTEFDKEFLYYLKKKYYPHLEDFDNPSQVSREVYTKGFAHKPAYTNFNGKEEIYFIGNENGYTNIYKVNINEPNEPEIVVHGERSEELEQFHYFRSGIDISEDGKLAFATQKGAADVIHIYNLKENKKIADYSLENIVGISSPSWSKDGKKIIFSGIEYTGKSDLYIFEPATEKLIRLTNDFYDDRDPDLSPDGKFIVFSSDRTAYGKNNKYNLFLYNLETNRISYLTHGNQIDFYPHYSSDGTKIIYTSDASGSFNIWYINLNETYSTASADTIPKTPTTRITNFTTAAYDPKWCGNDRICFSSFEHHSITLRLIDNIKEKTDTTITTKEDKIPEYFDNWTSKRIFGDIEKNTYKYKKRYSLDFAITSISADPVFGSAAGGILSLSDMLGDERYYFLVYNTSDGQSEFWKSFNIAISKVSLEHRLNYAYGVYHLSGKRYDLRESDFSYYERLYGGYFSLSYPLSFFRRIEATTSLSQSIKDIDILNYKRSLLLYNSLSYIKDNTLWDYTGPVDGERHNLTIGYVTDLLNSNEDYFSLMLDVREYIRISKPVSLAFRGQYFMNEGKTPRRFFLGGSWSLRGWPLNSIKGSKMWQTNIELRFPLIDLLAMQLPIGMELGFPGIKGAIFFDAGNCWDNADNYDYTRGSIGAGIRFNIFGILVLRFDMGKRIENNFTKLQKGFFYQFLFGWDY